MLEKDSINKDDTVNKPLVDSKRAELEPGTMLGRYEILRLLGRGGMGQVYLARHALRKKEQAIKILPSEFSGKKGFVERFSTELEVMSRLNHPNVVHAEYSDVENGLYYLVMDFVSADDTNEPYDLEEALAVEKQFSPEVTRRLAMQLCEGLAYAHAQGVVHRDLKPANVLLTSRKLLRADVRIGDFGLAKIVGEDQVRSMAMDSIKHSMSIGGQSTFVEKKRVDRSISGSILGTYGYMSPEQEEGRTADARSDLYALGVMLYRMVTGQRLRGMAKHASEVNPDLDPSWDHLIAKCLDADPAKRWQSAEDLKKALSKVKCKRSAFSKLVRKPVVRAFTQIVALLVTVGCVAYFGSRSLSQSNAEKQAVSEWTRAKTQIARLEKLERIHEFVNMADLQNRFATAESLTRSNRFNEAANLFVSIRTECEDLNVQYVNKVETEKQRKEAEKSRDICEQIKRDGEAEQLTTEGGDFYIAAVDAETKALASFASSRYPEASKSWDNAAEAFKQAKQFSLLRMAYKQSKANLEAEIPSDIKLLETYGRNTAQWNEFQKKRQLGDALSGDPGKGSKAYDEALRLLPSAIAEARRAKEHALLSDRVRIEREEAEAAYEVYASKVKPVVDRLVKDSATIEGKEARTLLRDAETVVALPLQFNQTKLSQTSVQALNTMQATIRSHIPMIRILPCPDMAWDSPTTGMAFIWVPALKLWVSKFETTNSDYRKMVPDHDSGVYEGHSLNGERQPVVQVKASDATSFAEWLTRQDRKVAKLPEHFIYRLPTEAEWLTIAQDGSNQEFPWGNEWPPRSHQAGNYAGQETEKLGWKYCIEGGYRDLFIVTCDVEKSVENSFGLFGVGGNVFECCAPDAADKLSSVWRGGAWNMFRRERLTCASRDIQDGQYKSVNCGFRLVLSANK